MSLEGHAINTQYDLVGRDYIAAREAAESTGKAHPTSSYILSHLIEPQGRELADVGCGGGEDLVTYRQLGLHAVGVDPSLVMVEEARRRLGDDTAAIVGSWTDLPLKDQSLHYLVGRGSLHYVRDVDEAYREAARVLRPEGKMILSVAHPDKVDVRETHFIDGCEYVYDRVFDGQIPIRYPRHTIEEYFSALFSELFKLEDRTDVVRQRANGLVEPGQMQIVARRLS